jgi:hypothetical protein
MTPFWETPFLDAIERSLYKSVSDYGTGLHEKVLKS